MAFYVRDDQGRFAASTVGPAARSAEGFWQELALRPPTPSGHFIAVVDDVTSKVYVEGGYGQIDFAP